MNIVKLLRDLIEAVFVRASLWSTLRRDARHPVARHLARHLKRDRRLSLLPLSLVFALALMLAFAYAYTVIADAVVWTLPLWLMLFSTFYCAIWIARIVALLMRQARDGVLEEVSVIPPGRVFVYVTVCKVVLNNDDAVVWLGLLRLVLAGVFSFVLAASLCIALTQLSDVAPIELVSLLLELTLLIVIIPLEHSQSAVIACLVSIEVSNQLRWSIDRTSAAIIGFVLLQIMSYAVAVAIALVLNAPNLGFVLILFALIREVVISAMWRLILLRANADGTSRRSDNWREVLEIGIQ